MRKDWVLFVIVGLILVVGIALYGFMKLSKKDINANPVPSSSVLGDTSNDFYKKILDHKKILATPHIAFATQQAKKNGLETVVKNVEAFMVGRPINLVVKK